MPAPCCCLRWAGALPRPPEYRSPKEWTPFTKRSVGVLLKCLTCVFVILLTVPPVVGASCSSRNRVPLDGASRALLAPQVVEAVLESETTGSPVFKAVFRVTRVYKRARGPRRLKKHRPVSLSFRRPGEDGDCDGLFAANFKRRKYFLFLNVTHDRSEPLQSVFLPLASTKRSKRRIKSIVCTDCAKAPSVGRLRDDSVVRGQSANLTCTFDGTPAPGVTWMKDEKPIDPSRSRNIRIHTRRVRIRPRIRRPRRRRRRRDSRRRNDIDGLSEHRRRKSRRRKSSRGKARPVRVISTLSFRASRDKDAGIYSCVGKSVLGEASARAGLTVVPPLDPGIVYPCPYDSYCLNGGTCMFFKHFGEFVCQCAEGFKGQRCQEKEVFPTFRDHNCRSSFPFLAPSRGLRCPRNQPVFLWEILQQSLAAHKQKVSPWTKAHHLAWSPPHTSARARLPWSRFDARMPVTSSTHLRHPHNLNKHSYKTNTSSNNFFYLPESGYRRKGQLKQQLPYLRTIFALPSGLNISLNEQSRAMPIESRYPNLTSLVHSTVIEPGGLFINNTERNLNSHLSNSVRPSPFNGIPKKYSGHRNNHIAPMSAGESRQQLLSYQRLQNSKSPNYLAHNESKEQTAEPINDWSMRPTSAHMNSYPGRRFAYPTSITPDSNKPSSRNL